MTMASPPDVSNTTGRFLIAPTARIATWGWLMMGVPMRLPKVPTLERVKVPPWVSSGFSLPWRALSARVLTWRASPVRLSSSALRITGTMRLPEGRAVAMPILISFLMMILSPSMELFISGYFLRQRMTASKNSGVKVSLVLVFFSKSFLTFSRQRTILVTSASEKLVTWALVCMLRTMWSAMRRRIRSISMISTLPLYTGMVVCDAATGSELEGVGVDTSGVWVTFAGVYSAGVAVGRAGWVAPPPLRSATY